MESNNVKLLSNNKESQTTSPLYARFDSDLLSASQSTKKNPVHLLVIRIPDIWTYIMF